MSASIGRLVPLLVSLSPAPCRSRRARAQPPTFGAANRTVAVYATVTSAQGRLVPT